MTLFTPYHSNAGHGRRATVPVGMAPIYLHRSPKRPGSTLLGLYYAIDTYPDTHRATSLPTLTSHSWVGDRYSSIMSGSCLSPVGRRPRSFSRRCRCTVLLLLLRLLSPPAATKASCSTLLPMLRRPLARSGCRPRGRVSRRRACHSSKSCSRKVPDWAAMRSSRRPCGHGEPPCLRLPPAGVQTLL